MSRWPMAIVAAEQRGERTDGRHDRERDRGELEEGGRAGDHVDAGGHHRRGVDEGRDRGRALHGVGEPDVERDLRGLARCADEQQQRDRGRHADAQQPVGLAEHDTEVERAEGGEDQHEADEEAPVADAVDDERLLARCGGRRFGEPEADEQVGRQPDQLPADEHEPEVVRQHQRQHRGDEQVHVAEEARDTARRRACSRPSRCGSASRRR